MKKVLFVSSAGGHLSELMQMEPLIEKYNSYIMTEKTESTLQLKYKYKSKISYLCHSSRKPFIKFIFKFIYNILMSIYIYIKIRPDIIISTGASCTVPICYIGKLLKTKIIYIESFARVETLSMSGKSMTKIADLFFVQHKELHQEFPNTIYKGALF